MLYNKTANLYRKTTNNNNVSKYSGTILATFSCNIQPDRARNASFDGQPAFNGFTIYTDYIGIEVGDKIIIDSINYIVDEITVWDGILRKYSEILAQKSEYE